MKHNTVEVYQYLYDDKSRFLYEKRCMWSLTQDHRYIDDIILSLIDKEQADKLMDKARSVSDRLVIRGAGNEYGTLRRFYPDLRFACFADRDPVKVSMKEIDGHPVISLDEFYEEHGGDYVLVTSSAYNKEILKELLQHGFPEDHILNFGVLCQSPEQYFEPGIITPQEHEVFVDGGCYDGATIRRFVSWCGGRYDAIYSYEPDRQNYQLALDRFAAWPVRDLKLINKGLWSGEEVLHFNESGTQGSGIVGEDKENETISQENGVIRIETTSIDQTVAGAPVSFIKLDVEGAEYEALRGAEDTIRKYHPRMAVSIYHKPEDIFTLPELIMSYSEEYRFYLRHYQFSQYETILYAV